jgi:hypothetical protein
VREERVLGGTSEGVGVRTAPAIPAAWVSNGSEKYPPIFCFFGPVPRLFVALSTEWSNALRPFSGVLPVFTASAVAPAARRLGHRAEFAACRSKAKSSKQ